MEKTEACGAFEEGDLFGRSAESVFFGEPTLKSGARYAVCASKRALALRGILEVMEGGNDL
jgi:hypothetical protein